MKQTILITFVLALLIGVGVAGAVTYLYWGGQEAGAGSETPGVAVEAPRTETSADLEARIQALAAENLDLRLRLESLEQRPAPDSRLPLEEPVSREEFDALVAQLDELLEQESSVPTDDREFEKDVANALIEIRRNESVSKVRDYQEKRTARLEDDLDEMRDWLGLSGYQVDEMRGILTAQYDREAEVRRLWEEGASDEVLGELKVSGGELFREEVAEALTPEQAERFWQGRSRKGGR